MTGSSRTLRRKLLRDAWRSSGQLLAIALVMAAGVGVHLGMRSTMESLLSARDSFYAESRFADVFASLVRAPERVARELAEIPGVATLETRVTTQVTLELEGVVESINASIVSLPDRGRPRIDDVTLREGRLPREGSTDEVLVSEGFALARRLGPGSELVARIDGRLQTLRVVGVALSPEFTYAVGPGQVIPDDTRYGVLWMRRAALARAVDLEGAFGDVVLRLADDASTAAVIDAVDRVLAPWGGAGAVARADQISAFFLDNELKQVATLARVLPILFLGVSALLLNVVLARLVATQRGEIGALKAFGYTDAEVGWHFAELVGLVLAVGCGAGVGLGLWLTDALTGMYAEYYRLPDLVGRLGAREALEALVTAGVAGGLGATLAVRRVVRLPPAEALRAAPPARYRPTLVERLGLSRRVPPAARIVLRELERRPLRAALSAFGIAAATALAVVNMFTVDAVGRLLDVQYGLAQREDVRLTFAEPRDLGVLSSIASLPGVRAVEPTRDVGVRLRAGAREELTAITGRRPDARLSQLLDRELESVQVPRGGLTLARKLAEQLEVRPGDRVRVEVLEGRRPELTLPVARVVETYVGASAEADLDDLARWLGEPTTADGALLLVDHGARAEFHRAVRRSPLVIGVSERGALLSSVRAMLAENLGTTLGITIVFSGVIALGVLYNAVRIQLAERSRDLASLRVLGFRRREVAAILTGEVAVLVALGLPVGLWFGGRLAELLVRSPGFDTEQFRLPYVIEPRTWAVASLIVLLSAVVCGWAARRRMDRFDLVSVLKARD